MDAFAYEIRIFVRKLTLTGARYCYLTFATVVKALPWFNKSHQRQEQSEH